MLDSLPGGRASLTLPRAILRVAPEKAGAGESWRRRVPAWLFRCKYRPYFTPFVQIF